MIIMEYLRLGNLKQVIKMCVRMLVDYIDYNLTVTYVKLKFRGSMTNYLQNMCIMIILQK